MKILVACEYSGKVREAFRKQGHEVWSCDLLESDDKSPFHIQGDVTPLLTQGWDLMVAHPPCTYLSNSGVSWMMNKNGTIKNQDRWNKMIEGAEFFRTLLDAPIPKIAIENPIMHKYAIEIVGRRQDQVIQPFWFGEDAKKATCLWLKNLPPLKPTNLIIKDRYANQTASGQNKLPPSKDRWKLRSETYQGIADAIGNQFK